MRRFPPGRGKLVGMLHAISLLLVMLTAGQASAAQSTYTLRPDADVSSQWSKVGAATAADALDDGVTQPSAVGTTDYISSGAANKVTEVSLANQALGSGESVSSGKAWFYAAAGILSSAKAEVVSGGTVRGSATVNGGLLGAGAQWYSISFTPADQSAVNDLRLRFTSTGGSDVSVRADRRTRRFATASGSPTAATAAAPQASAGSSISSSASRRSATSSPTPASATSPPAP